MQALESMSRPSGPTVSFWSLDEIMPWPLEHLTRQYIGFNQFVVKEYNDLVEYDDSHDRLKKRSPIYWSIAQWRRAPQICVNPYIYQFRSVLCNNDDTLYGEYISEPRKFYRDIAKTGVQVGRVV